MTTKPKHFELWDVDAWTIVEANVDLPAFYRLNPDLTYADQMVIETLLPGHSFHFGGGAATLYAIRRVE